MIWGLIGLLIVFTVWPLLVSSKPRAATPAEAAAPDDESPDRDETDDGGSETDDEPPAPELVDPSYRAKALVQAALVSLVCGVALSMAFSTVARGAMRMLPIVGATYLVLCIGACLFLHRRGELRDQLVPRRLDITAGGLIAAAMFLMTTVVPTALARGRSQEVLLQWLIQVHDQLGARAAWVGPAILLIAAVEEIVWRGWVMRALQTAYGAKRALLVTTALYALVHAATPFTLRAADAGPNPLIIGAAILGGLVWGTIAQWFGRLGPSIAAHAIFSWATVIYPLWRRMG
jgi:membrane protease YdiL (CAAX protease family)